MIKLFGKIRQKMLTENKFNKYLFYAIGEIILVVIGILIALQLNNWNQDRKNNEESKTLLLHLQEDVGENIKNLKELQESIEIRKNYAGFILKALDDQKVTDSIKFIAAMTRVGWIMNYSQALPTYDEIISSGKLSYINSKKLKNELAIYKSGVEEKRQIASPINMGLKKTERLAIGHLKGMPKASNLIKPVSSYKGVSFDLSSIAADIEFYKNVKYICYQSALTKAYIEDLFIIRLKKLKSLIAHESSAIRDDKVH
jgi:hypothetical protein